MAEFVLRKKEFLCDICIADDAPKNAMAAAGELIRLLSIQSGRTPVLHYGIPKEGDLCLGAKSGDCEIEELRIEVQNNILWIDGGKRGILYGVYELMEQLGFRFLADDCEVIPKEEVLCVPGDLKTSQKPVFEYRSSSWCTITPKMAPKMRMNTCGHGPVPEMKGGMVVYEGWVHTLGELAEMELVNGEYTDRQPCLTDEKVYQTVIKNLKKNLKNNPKASIASVSQNDSHAWGRGCQCPECRKLDEAEGTPMGSLLPFVNRVAEEMEKENPELAIDTLAYRYTRKAPATLKARHNVIVRLCSIECCFSHPIAECDYRADEVEDVHFADCLREWAKHCDRIYIWDYTTNFESFHNCFPNFNVLRKNARFFAENNVRGIYEQGNRQTVNGEFGPLRAYLISKILWDPYMSEETYQRHIDDFMKGYYGAGWKSIRCFFDRMQRSAEKVHFSIYYKDPVQYFVDPDSEGTWEERAEAFLKKGRMDFAEALQEADSVQREHISRAEIQLDLYEWYLIKRKLDAAEATVQQDELKQQLYKAGANLYTHVLTYGISAMQEFRNQPTILDEVPDFMSEPPEWGRVL